MIDLKNCPMCDTPPEMARPSPSAVKGGLGNKHFFVRCVNSGCPADHLRTRNRRTEQEAADDWHALPRSEAAA
jgi:hypothetical protein